MKQDESAPKKRQNNVKINEDIAAVQAENYDDKERTSLHVSPEVARSKSRGRCSVLESPDHLQQQNADEKHDLPKDKKRRVFRGADLPKGLPRPPTRPN